MTLTLIRNFKNELSSYDLVFYASPHSHPPLPSSEESILLVCGGLVVITSNRPGTDQLHPSLVIINRLSSTLEQIRTPNVRVCVLGVGRGRGDTYASHSQPPPLNTTPLLF